MEDKIRGKIEELKGKVTKDKPEELKGKGRQKVGEVKDTARDVTEGGGSEADREA
jgi:uncharacterized protein YjbJ (UPF0337 family)